MWVDLDKLMIDYLKEITGEKYLNEYNIKHVLTLDD